MRLSLGLVGLVALAPAVLAQGNNNNNNNNNAQTTSQTQSQPQTSQAPTAKSTPSSAATSPSVASSISSVSLENGLVSLSSTPTPTKSDANPVLHLTGLPTIAGVGVPVVGVPDTAGAPYMHKSNLPDGTVFICVGAALGALGAAVLLWRCLVAWSLHRSVKRAALAQNLSDLKGMSAVPGAKKRGMYNVVNANSNMSLDHLAAAPTGTSKPPKPFASPTTNTPPKSTSSLFFSPTAGGGAAGFRDSVANRSSGYLPAGYYPTGTSQAAGGSPMTNVGGHGPHLSTHSLATPGNRLSTRSGISPPISPSLPPSSRGHDRAPPSRDSVYNRNSSATLGNPGNSRGIYDQSNPSQLSLNVPGGTNVAGGRAPSAYLEDLFENHGNGPRERF